MRTLFRLIPVAVYLIASNEANAVTGVLDAANEFPYVVQIKMDGGQCTGVVTSDNLVTTAAHCVWNKTTKALSQVTIQYKDMYGRDRTAYSRAVFIPPTYGDAAKEVSVYENSAGTEMTDPARWHAANLLRAMQDIAFVVPDRVIEVDGYAHWITELLVKPYSTYLSDIGCGGSFDTCTNRPTKLQEDNLVGVIQRELGDLTKVRARVVGYGGFDCLEYTKDAQGNDECKLDGRRRMAEAPLVPFITFGGVSYGVPWVWCTGTNSEGVNPVRRGDSGGPLFVRAIDGRWLFAGYIAIGGIWGCSSSVIYNLALWRSVLRSKEFGSMPWEHQKGWHVKQTERAVYELFAAFSLPNAEAEPRLRSIYGLTDNIDTQGVNVNGKAVSHRELYNLKRQLFERWPNRTYTVDSSSLRIQNVEPRPGHGSPDAYYEVRALVNWDFKNQANNSARAGLSEYKLLFNLVGMQGSQLTGHLQGPVVDEEVEIVLGQSPGDVKVQHSFSVSENMTIQGGDYWDKKGISARECQRICQEQPNCVAFSFVDRSQWCWIKSWIPNYSSARKQGIISGWRKDSSN
jgi:hypothetical protein